MNKFAKVVVTIVVIFIFMMLFTVVVGVSDSNGHTPGILGMILLAGLIGALRALWKEPKDENKEDENKNDSSILQK